MLTHGSKLPEIDKIALLPCCCHCYHYCYCHSYCAGKLPEIAKMLTEFTGQSFDRTGVHNLVLVLLLLLLMLNL